MKKDEKMYHIGLSVNDIENAKYAILPGDPGRVYKIATYLENPKYLSSNREYTSYLGYLEGEPVLVMSTGMGGPSTAIAVEELSSIGIENVIRVGTSGGMQLNVSAGDVVIAQAAVRQEGTSKEYVPIEFPAVANFDLVSKLKNAADEMKVPNHIGIVHCKDSFYGQHNPGRMPVSYELENKWQAWIKSGVLCSEMETAALYTVSSVLGIKAAAILLVIWNQEKEKRGMPQETDFNVNRQIEVTINALKSIIKK